MADSTLPKKTSSTSSGLISGTRSTAAIGVVPLAGGGLWRLGQGVATAPERTLDGVRTQLSGTETGKAPEEAADGGSRDGDDIDRREAGHLDGF